MTRRIQRKVEPGEALMREAISALRRYHEAHAAGVAPKQVERLRLIAELAYQAVIDYQLCTLGHQPLTRH